VYRLNHREKELNDNKFLIICQGDEIEQYEHVNIISKQNAAYDLRLMEFKRKVEDDDSIYYYTVGDRISVKDLAESKGVSGDDFSKIIGTLAYALANAGKHRLSPECIIIDSEYVYIGEVDVLLTYVPVELANDVKAEFERFASYLSDKLFDRKKELDKFFSVIKKDYSFDEIAGCFSYDTKTTENTEITEKKQTEEKIEKHTDKHIEKHIEDNIEKQIDEPAEAKKDQTQDHDPEKKHELHKISKINDSDLYSEKKQSGLIDKFFVKNKKPLITETNEKMTTALKQRLDKTIKHELPEKTKSDVLGDDDFFDNDEPEQNKEINSGHKKNEDDFFNEDEDGKNARKTSNGYLTCLNPDNTISRVKVEIIESPFKIGRGANYTVMSNQLLIPKHYISKQHAVITKESESFFISDVGTSGEGSMGGTFVNDYKLMPNKKRPLANGDVIKFFTLEYVFSLAEINGAIN